MRVAPHKRERRPPDPPDVASPATGGQASVPPPRGILAAWRHSGILAAWRHNGRRTGGRLELLPVIISLMSTWVIFQLLDDNHRFLTAANLSNMLVQIAGTAIMAIGITLVLLLGEIDLSIGSMSGLAAAILAILYVRHGVPEVLAIGMVVLFGLGVGALHGIIHAAIGAPSFVVTLAGLIGWQGLQLYLLSPQGAINIPDHGVIAALTHDYLPGIVGWSLAALLIGCYLIAIVVDRRRRSAAGLACAARWRHVVRLVLLSAVVGVTVLTLNAWRGVPVAVALAVAFTAGFDLVLRKTSFGRSIMAIGGNVEAARRAGIPVTRIRVTVFALGSAMAAIGGIMAVSREFAANQSTGGSNVLLFAIAAAVIGGVSLFGGRGSTYGALLGIAVIGSITNGMYLLELDTSVQLMITAVVLLIAVVIDSVSRRGRLLLAGPKPPPSGLM